MNSRRSISLLAPPAYNCCGGLLTSPRKFINEIAPVSSCRRPTRRQRKHYCAQTPPSRRFCSVSGAAPTLISRLHSGSTWSYSSPGSILGPYTYTSTLADVSDTGFYRQRLTSLGGGTSSSVKWNCQDGNPARQLDSGSDSSERIDLPK